jgi:hypothetical protein
MKNFGFPSACNEKKFFCRGKRKTGQGAQVLLWLTIAQLYDQNFWNNF